MTTMARETLPRGVRAARWRRTVAAGFGFFLVKGLAWLTVPVLAWLAG